MLINIKILVLINISNVIDIEIMLLYYNFVV